MRVGEKLTPMFISLFACFYVLRTPLASCSYYSIRSNRHTFARVASRRGHKLRPVALVVEGQLSLLLLRAVIDVMMYLIRIDVACKKGGSMYAIKRAGAGGLRTT